MVKLATKRSAWKGPFVDGHLFKAARKVKESGRVNQAIKTWSRRSTIMPEFVGLIFLVYNGRKHIPVQVTEEHVGYKFGAFSPTRTFTGHGANRKASRG
jgi:small subunit ribosomal protein S19